MVTQEKAGTPSEPGIQFELDPMLQCGAVVVGALPPRGVKGKLRTHIVQASQPPADAVIAAVTVEAQPKFRDEGEVVVECGLGGNLMMV